MTISFMPPFLIFLIGAFFALFLRGKVLKWWIIIVPAVALVNAFLLQKGFVYNVHFIGLDLVPLRIDALSYVFGLIFCIISLLNSIYAYGLDDPRHHVATLLTEATALGIVFAGDYFSLFLFWELEALSTSYLIAIGGREGSLKASFRYLLMHITGGIFLLGGILLHFHQTGSIAFNYLGLTNLASLLILIGFGINAVFPLLHTWLPDAYPQASYAGTVVLSAFTTKSAVYTLARAFPGTEALIVVGVIMTAFPIFFAVIENDMRKVLSYSLINQVGFMVTGIGIGTALSLNGTVAHAFAHILYKALLFMSMGAVFKQTGKIKATELGGLFRTMPWTLTFCIVGAASISGVPLTSGFVSKSMIVAASAHQDLTIVWFILLFASAGVFHHSGIKIPFFAFFSHDSGLRPKEAPFHMLLAMGIAAFLCIAIGVYPWALYSILPFPVHYVPYAPNHVMEMIELLGFSALAFTLLMLSGIYPPEMRAINLDFDWVYRRSLQLFMYVDRKVVVVIEDRIVNTAYEWLFLNPIMFFARFFKGVDTYVVDGTVNGSAKATYSVSKTLRKLQTGNLQDYMILFVIGILILACVIILLRGGI